MNKDDIVKELKEGNMRFITDKCTYPNQNKEYIKKLAKEGQKPIAVIVCCSDSRVNPVLFFDRGFGDFFIVRTAGNVLDSHAIESIEFAVNNLKTPLILVLGHTKCGAVTSAIKKQSEDVNGGAIMKSIKPAVDEANSQSGCIIENTTKNNTQNMKDILKNINFKNKVDIISGLYDLETGEVIFYEL